MKDFIKNKIRRYLTESEKKTAQELGISDTTFYHGTTHKIDKLDPTFRQSSPDSVAGKNTGSSQYGVGIYFSNQLGFDPENPKYSESGGLVQTDSGENALKWTKTNKVDTLGYIYEIKLKPDAHIIDKQFVTSDGTQMDIDIRDIHMKTYKLLREEGVDVVYSSGEIVLLNPDSVRHFKLIYKSEKKYRVTPLKRGKPQTELSKLLKKEDVEGYLKQELDGSYKKVTRKDKWGQDEDLYINYDTDGVFSVAPTVGNLERV